MDGKESLYIPPGELRNTKQIFKLRCITYAFSSRSSLFEASSIDETILEEDVFESQNYEIKYRQPSYFAILISYIDNARPIRRILWFIFSKVLLE